jgi:hypothetical protein
VPTVSLITQVLEENGEPMRARGIHHAVQAIAGRHMPWSTVIDCLITNAAREESRLTRVAHGVYALLPAPHGEGRRERRPA